MSRQAIVEIARVKNVLVNNAGAFVKTGDLQSESELLQAIFYLNSIVTRALENEKKAPKD